MGDSLGSEVEEKNSAGQLQAPLYPEEWYLSWGQKAGTGEAAWSETGRVSNGDSV